MKLNDLTLCLLTHRQDQSFQKYQPFLQQAIAGGVTSIQYRDKDTSPQRRLRFALQLRDYLAQCDIPLIVNDDVLLAAAIEADGVHLGQSDMSVQQARVHLREGVWLGLSIETMPQLMQANQIPDLQYVAASAVFASTTKVNCQTYWGLSGLREIVSQSVHPVVAIGGIHLHNARSVMQQGACGIAVIGAIHEAPCPRTMAARFTEILREQGRSDVSSD